MSQSDLLIEAVTALDEAGVGYVLTGSLVSSLQGEPRARRSNSAGCSTCLTPRPVTRSISGR